MSSHEEVDQELLLLWRTGRSSRDRGRSKPYLLQDVFRDIGGYLKEHVRPEWVVVGLMLAILTFVILILEPFVSAHSTLMEPLLILFAVMAVGGIICGLSENFDDDSERCKCKGKYCPCCGKRRH